MYVQQRHRSACASAQLISAFPSRTLDLMFLHADSEDTSDCAGLKSDPSSLGPHVRRFILFTLWRILLLHASESIRAQSCLITYAQSCLIVYARDLPVSSGSSLFLIFFMYSWLSLSRTRLSRITAYLEVKIWSLPKHENPTTGKKKYCGKEEKLLLYSTIFSIYELVSLT